MSRLPPGAVEGEAHAPRAPAAASPATVARVFRRGPRPEKSFKLNNRCFRNGGGGLGEVIDRQPPKRPRVEGRSGTQGRLVCPRLLRFGKCPSPLLLCTTWKSLINDK